MTKIERIITFVFALILFFGSIWLFTWIGQTGPDWVAFPSFVSGVFGAIAGVIGFVASIKGTFKDIIE